MKKFMVGQPVRVNAFVDTRFGIYAGGAVGRVTAMRGRPTVVTVWFPIPIAREPPQTWWFGEAELTKITEEEYLVWEVMAS